MLTREQIQRIAQKSSIGAHAQERDYLQSLLLYLLYSRSQDFIFKGGTAIRLVHHGNRFSEDLDFNGPTHKKNSEMMWQSIIKELALFGITSEIRNSWQSETSYSFDVSFQGPLFDGRDRTKGKIRVDVNLRLEPIESRRALLTPDYDDLRPFVVTVLTEEHLMAEKARAFLTRQKPRDAYDIWFLAHKGVKMQPAILSSKLALYEFHLTPESLSQALSAAGKSWRQDMRSLLPQFIEWEDISEKIQQILHPMELTFLDNAIN